MSKCSKISYFYFCCRSEFWDVPRASGINLRYSCSHFLKFSTFCFSPSSSFSSFLKVTGILLYNGGPILKKQPFLKDLTGVGDALLIFCFDVTFTFVLGLL